MLRLLAPDQYLRSAMDVDLEALKKEGVKGLIVDLDNTIVPRYEDEPSQELKEWLEKVRGSGLRVVIVSNNWTSRVRDIAEELGVALVRGARKPFPGSFKNGMRLLGTASSETAVIGDQIFTDVLGANRLGLRTVLVVPMSEREMLHTRMLRKLEYRVLNALVRRQLIEPNVRG